MEQLLTAIIQRLEANAAELGASYIDEEYDQVDMLDETGRDSYPVTFPAVLVDCAGEQWTSLSRGMQSGKATVNVNIYLDCYDDTHAYSTQIFRVADRMSFVRSVSELLQGWEPLAVGGALVRQSTSTRTRNHGIKLYQLVFTMPVYERFGSDASHLASSAVLSVSVKKGGNDE